MSASVAWVRPPLEPEDVTVGYAAQVLVDLLFDGDSSRTAIARVDRGDPTHLRLSGILIGLRWAGNAPAQDLAEEIEPILGEIERVGAVLVKVTR